MLRAADFLPFFHRKIYLFFHLFFYGFYVFCHEKFYVFFYVFSKNVEKNVENKSHNSWFIMNIFSVTCFPTVSHKLIILESKENFLLSESKIADKCFKCAISEGKLNRNCNTHPNFRLWRQSSSFISSIISIRPRIE